MITWHTEKRKLSDLIEWGRNPRQLSKHDAEHIKRSLEKFGVADPLVVNTDNLIIGGHQRKRILQMIAEADPNYEVDVRIPDRTLTDEEVAELNIRLNKNSGSWDWDVLANEFEAMELLDWGFTEEELTGLDFGYQEEVEDAEPQIDKAEELREKWGVKTGQLWKLGEHRLICGDCTDKSVVDRVMGGEKAQFCFTSPPYADMRTYTNDGDLSPKHLSDFITVACDAVDIFAVNLGLKRENGEIKEYWRDYIDTAHDSSLRLLSWNVWSRHGFGGSVGNMTAMFPIEHEWVFVFGKEAKEINRTVPNKHGGKTVSATVRGADGNMSAPQTYAVRSEGKLGSVFVSDVARGEKDHPAMFPIEFPEAYVDACTNLGGIVYEPFSGSGTTLIACERLNRKCRAIEISPAYCAVSIQRWVDATGGEPELIDG